MSLFDYLNYQWTKGDKNWHIPYNNALTALKDFLGDKGTNTDLGGGLTTAQAEILAARGGAANLQSRIDPIESEVLSSRGTTANLATRLASVINPDGTPVAGASVAVEFKAEITTPTFVSVSSFKIPADKTAIYVRHRKVKLTLNGGDVVAAITGSSFVSPDTTVTIDSAVIDNTISVVAYGIDTPASTPKDPRVDDNTDMNFWNAERNSIDAGIALLMDKGWIDSFDTQDQQGADEAASVGFAYDLVSKFYKGTDGGAGLNLDFPFSVEANYLQKDFTNANQTTSQTTFTNASAVVTISSGTWPTNVANMRITPDAGATWLDIKTRDSATQITLNSNFTGTTGAKDYIIRPTEFVATYQSFLSVPMPSASTAEASVVASDEATSAFEGWRAFDSNPDSTEWVTNANGVFPQWLDLRLNSGVKKQLAKYIIRTNSATDAPKDFKIQGSDDAVNWVDIDVRVGVTGWTAGVDKEFFISSFRDAFSFTRLYITAVNGGLRPDISNLVYQEISSGFGQLNGILNGFTADTVPTMTSNTAPSGVVSASSSLDAAHDPWYVFNDDGASNQWATVDPAPLPVNISYDYGAGITKLITQYVIQGTGNTLTQPKDWTFEGSNDNFSSDINILDIQSNITLGSAEIRTFNSFTNLTPYRYYRLNISAIFNSTALQIGEIEFMEDAFLNVVSEPSAIVPAFNQLKNSSSVTDINSVVATETLNGESVKYVFIFGPVGMTAYNDILTEVKIWNQGENGFMPVIAWDGAKWQRNTATVIVNPDSSTGQIYTSDSGTPANAFDGNSGTIWSTSDTAFPHTLTVQYGTAITIKQFSLKAFSSNNLLAPRDFKLQGSNDGTTFVDIVTFTGILWGIDEQKLFDVASNTTAYLYYRVYVTANNNGTLKNVQLSVVRMSSGLPGTTASLIDSTGAGATDIVHALSEAIDSNAALSMTGADIGAITDAEFEAAGGVVVATHTQYGIATVFKSTNTLNNPQVDLIRTNWDAVRTGMTFQSKTLNPNFVPAEAYLWARIEHFNADGPGTFYISRDGGTTWTVTPMTQQGLPISGNIRIFRGTLLFTTEPSGQDFRVRYATAQGKDQFIHSWGLQARQ